MSFESEFKFPSAERREAPFWAWNGLLEGEELQRQIETFARMGMGGFFMHPRSGMRTAYLSDAFMEAVRVSVEKAKALGLKAWLYDEDRWPSGSVSGLLTRDPRLCGRSIAPTFSKPEAPVPEEDHDGEVLAVYDVRLDEEGFLLDYRRVTGNAEPPPAGFRRLFCVKSLFRRENWFNGERYVDVLNPEATRAFLEMTHERYAALFAAEFGRTVPGIFTDEPQMRFHDLPSNALDLSRTRYPYTDALPDLYRQRFRADLWETFPEIIWDRPGREATPARYRYMQLLTERMHEAYFRPIAVWCRKHGLAFTGHLMSEHNLNSQAAASGEAMLHYQAFDIPGVDMLEDHIELTTLIQAASVAHQEGRAELLSELDGATDWRYSFQSHKLHGDWQAALGVTLRVPHLAWYTMEGEAKRDYPSPIDAHAPWHAKYPIVADHFARLGTVLRRGRPLTEVAVIHPVESAWLLRGPASTSAERQAQIEADFQSVSRWLCEGLVPFDFISEALLPRQEVAVEEGRLKVGAMHYRTVIVPPLLTMRASTLDWLERFQNGGGTLLFLGEPHALCDAVPSERPAALAKRRISFGPSHLLEALEPEIAARDLSRGLPLKTLLANIRQDGARRYVFLCDTQRRGNAHETLLRLRGSWAVEMLDTLTGDIRPMASSRAGDETRLTVTFAPGAHLLLRLTPSRADEAPRPAAQSRGVMPAIAARVSGHAVPITRDEPNVLVLDMPEWRLNGGEWNPPEEIHRLNNRIRQALDLPPVEARGRQAWTLPPAATEAMVSLRFSFQARVPFRELHLALEHPEETAIALDGCEGGSGWGAVFDTRASRPAEKPLLPDGNWADASLATIPLPPMPAGGHTITFTRRYTENSTLERVFLLGDFDVILHGTEAALKYPSGHLDWGDWTRQGLPFYSGNLTYHASFFLDAALGNARLALPSRSAGIPASDNVPFANGSDGFRGALVAVCLDGKPAGEIAFSPFELQLGRLEAGRHALDLTLYAHRFNAFGAFHQVGSPPVSPRSWFPENPLHSREYLLAPLGILLEPLILTDC